jgi:myo-inositol 2-dehydrogenase/D-chiro-inositol 1-dehydrogenase
MSFKLCTIGCGNLATSSHGLSYKKYAELNPDVLLAACCDLDEKKAVTFKDYFGFARHYTNFVEMLNTEKPDAVCLVIPVGLTAQLSTRIMEMGYPLMMEKPPGLDKEEALRMLAAAEKTGVPNQVAFNRRYIPLVQRLKEVLNKNFKAEDIQSMCYEIIRTGRKDPDFSTTAIHGIDATRFIAGSDYKYIRFHYQEHPELGTGVANIFMECVMQSGATAYLNFCPIAGTSVERVTVNLHDHTFFLNIPIGKMDFPGELIHVEKNEVKLKINGKELSDSEAMYELNGFYNENASFFDDLRAGRRPKGDLKSSFQSVEVAEYIRKRLPEYEAK